MRRLAATLVAALLGCNSPHDDINNLPELADPNDRTSIRGLLETPADGRER